MELNYLVLTHGAFGKALILSAELIAGKIENMEGISLEKTMSIEDYIHVVETQLNHIDGNIILLTDLFGGTPNNVAMYLQNKHGYPVISGVNLPMILEFALMTPVEDESTEEFMERVIESSKNAMRLQINGHESFDLE